MPDKSCTDDRLIRALTETNHALSCSAGVCVLECDCVCVISLLPLSCRDIESSCCSDLKREGEREWGCVLGCILHMLCRTGC